MTLGEMRKAVEKMNQEPEEEKNSRPKSRLPPDNRGVKESRSCLVEVDLPGGSAGRKGTLTFANSVSHLKRAGSSRADVPRRSAPRRAQSCIDG